MNKLFILPLILGFFLISFTLAFSESKFDKIPSNFPFGSNVSSVTSTTGCITVNPTTGNVQLTFNESCGGTGGGLVDSVTSGDGYISASPTTGNVVLTLTSNATQWFYNQSDGNGIWTNVSGVATFEGNANISGLFYSEGERISSSSPSIIIDDTDGGSAELGKFLLRTKEASPDSFIISGRNNGDSAWNDYFFLHRSGFLNVTVDSSFSGNLNVLKNITSDYYFGDGSQLTGISSGIWSNVSGVATYEGNVNASGTGEIYSNGIFRFGRNATSDAVYYIGRNDVTNHNSTLCLSQGQGVFNPLFCLKSYFGSSSPALGFNIGSSEYATLDSSKFKLVGDLIVDGTDIGISSDTDLLKLSPNMLKINGGFNSTKTSYVSSDSNIGLNVYSSLAGSGTSYAIYGESLRDDQYGVTYGVLGLGKNTNPASGTSQTVIGGQFEGITLLNSFGGVYGVVGMAKNGSTGYGVYGSSVGATTNWAGYFADGNVWVQNNISALNVVDRSQWCDMTTTEALNSLSNIKEKTGTNVIDKKSMPNCAVVQLTNTKPKVDGIDKIDSVSSENQEEVIIEQGRDLGAYVSYLTLVNQGLKEELDLIKISLCQKGDIQFCNGGIGIDG